MHLFLGFVPLWHISSSIPGKKITSLNYFTVLMVTIFVILVKLKTQVLKVEVCFACF